MLKSAILFFGLLLVAGGLWLVDLSRQAKTLDRGPASELRTSGPIDIDSGTRSLPGPNANPAHQQFSTIVEIPDGSTLSETSEVGDEKCNITTGPTEGIGYGSVIDLNLGIRDSEINKLILEFEHWLVPIPDTVQNPFDKSEFDIHYQNGTISRYVQRQIGSEIFDLKITLQVDRSFDKVYSAEIEIKRATPSFKPFELRALQARFSCSLAWS